MARRVVALSGPICSGKSDLGDGLIARFGVIRIETRALIRELLGVPVKYRDRPAIDWFSRFPSRWGYAVPFGYSAHTGGLMGTLRVITIFLWQRFQSRAALAAENLALRQQIVILQRSVKCPRLHRQDRIFWVWLSRLWRGWRSSLLVAQPETVIRWHREGFRLYWR